MTGVAPCSDAKVPLGLSPDSETMKRDQSSDEHKVGQERSGCQCLPRAVVGIPHNGLIASLSVSRNINWRASGDAGVAMAAGRVCHIKKQTTVVSCKHTRPVYLEDLADEGRRSSG